MIALNKMLNHLRFGNTSGEIQEMVFSPFIVDFHLRLTDKLRQECKKINVEIPEDFGYIEDAKNDSFTAIIGHIRTVADWKQKDKSLKMEIIELIVKPYKIKPATVEFLIDY